VLCKAVERIGKGKKRLTEIINIIREERSTENLKFRPIGTTGTTPRTPSKEKDGRWSVVRPKRQKRNQDP
jgi:hypothetical protein